MSTIKSNSHLEFPESFKILKDSPIDNRSVFATIADRDALVAARRYYGLLTFVQENGKFYYLDAGLANVDWKEFAVGSATIEGSFRKVTLPSRDSFVLKVTANTAAAYKASGYDYPVGAFPVKMIVKGGQYDGVEIAQFEAMYLHDQIDRTSGSSDNQVIMIPITPIYRATIDESGYDAYKDGFYTLKSGMGTTKGEVGFELLSGAFVSEETVELYYPAEMGELEAVIQY